MRVSIAIIGVALAMEMIAEWAFDDHAPSEGERVIARLDASGSGRSGSPGHG